jgi:pimeloyl-ACP methyl ester carboxylesterase
MTISLKQWQQDGSYFHFNGHNLFAVKAGHGSALLLIHGFPSSSFDWIELWPVLSKHYQLHALDILGFGLSDKPTDYNYSLKSSADQWQAYAQSQGLTEVSILAHDYGDTVLQELLARQLEGTLSFKINKACLLNGGIFPEATSPILMQKLLLSRIGPIVARLSFYQSFAKSMRSICTRALSDAHLRVHWQLLLHNDGRLQMPKIIQYIRERKIFRERWLQALQNATIPLCLINGIDGPISGASIVKRWRELLPHSPVVELHGVGHYPQWEEPKQVLMEVQNFLST